VGMCGARWPSLDFDDGDIDEGWLISGWNVCASATTASYFWIGCCR